MIDGINFQHCKQSPINPKDRLTIAAQANVSGPEMLASVDRDRPLFDDASADAVCAFQLLGPNPTEPGSPVFELACLCIFTAMRDYDARAITEQDGVAGLTNHLV